jgi:3-methylfumaryl-CoA hydratase
VSDPLRPEDLGATTHAASALARDHAELLALTLDVPPPGQELPPLWHWAFFPPRMPTAGLGGDGHPVRPEGGPLEGLPQRMWVGGRARWANALVIGQRAERVTTVVSVERKSGSQGEFVLATLRHELRQQGAVVMVEDQDLAYRPAGAAAARASATAPGHEEAGVSRSVDAALLFRYSALTFNTHRIHYDLAYASDVEGYPALVVQGPLTATLLAGLCGDERLASFEYRATAAAFAPGTLHLSRRDGDDGVELTARQEGVVTMRAVARTL